MSEQVEDGVPELVLLKEAADALVGSLVKLALRFTFIFCSLNRQLIGYFFFSRTLMALKIPFSSAMSNGVFPSWVGSKTPKYKWNYAYDNIVKWESRQ